MALRVSLEVHPKRTFAWAVEWPGWCRSGKTEEATLGALADYAGRYRAVAERAGLRLGAKAAEDIEVVERLPGDAATAFGVPCAVAEGDHQRLTARQAERQADLVAAGWRAARSGDAPQPKGWPPRYLARRIAWHALDHAWEIEDRSDPSG